MSWKMGLFVFGVIVLTLNILFALPSVTSRAEGEVEAMIVALLMLVVAELRVNWPKVSTFTSTLVPALFVMTKVGSTESLSMDKSPHGVVVPYPTLLLSSALAITNPGVVEPDAHTSNAGVAAAEPMTSCADDGVEDEMPRELVEVAQKKFDDDVS